MGVVPACMSVPFLCLISMEARRKCQIPWNGGSGQLGAGLLFLGIELRPWETKPVLLISRAISPVLILLFM